MPLKNQGWTEEANCCDASEKDRRIRSTPGWCLACELEFMRSDLAFCKKALRDLWLAQYRDYEGGEADLDRISDVFLEVNNYLPVRLAYLPPVGKGEGA